jgi:hippurate hydrolase
VQRAFAIHQTPILPSGWIATRGGPVMASSDVLRITVTGRGGHASMPHHALDPVPIACEIVQAIQTLVTRTVDAFDPSVVTVTRIDAGTTNNVIPETAEVLGTIRAVSEGTRQRVHDGLRRLVDGITAAHGAHGEVDIEFGYPVTHNDDNVATWSMELAKSIAGDGVVRMPNPIMGAEDFSYVLQRVPGATVFLGTCPPGVDVAHVAPNHSNRMVIDEAAMTTGIALYAAAALDYLR